MDGEDRQGGCHCGAVRFRVRLAGGLASAQRCTCSFCRMRGAVVALARSADVVVTEGQANLTLYRFNTGRAQHWFCRTCGIHTHHQSRLDPDRTMVNIACLEGVSPFDLTAVPVVNGGQDASDPVRLPWQAGVLRFERAP